MDSAGCPSPQGPHKDLSAWDSRFGESSLADFLNARITYSGTVRCKWSHSRSLLEWLRLFVSSPALSATLSPSARTGKVPDVPALSSPVLWRLLSPREGMGGWNLLHSSRIPHPAAEPGREWPQSIMNWRILSNGASRTRAGKRQAPRKQQTESWNNSSVL